MSQRQNARPVHARAHFQTHLPLYVKGKTLQAGGQFFKRGELFPWQDLGMSAERVANMFPRLVHHKIDASAPPREGGAPPRIDRPYVVPEAPAEELIQTKTLEGMSVRELRVVAKFVGAPIKRTIAAQRDAVAARMDELEAEEA